MLVLLGFRKKKKKRIDNNRLSFNQILVSGYELLLAGNILLSFKPIRYSLRNTVVWELEVVF